MSVREQAVIKRLRVKNYRGLADVDVSFDRLIILVGANGSGKSSIIDVLKFVRDTMVRDLDRAIVDRGGISSLRRWSSKDASDVSIQITVHGMSWWGEYSFVVGSGKKGDWRVKSEILEINRVLLSEDAISDSSVSVKYQIREGKIIERSSVLDHLGEGLVKLVSTSSLLFKQLRVLDVSGLIDEFYIFLSEMSFYVIYPDALRVPQIPGNEYPLEENGQNLASVLRNLQNKRHQEVNNILNDALGRVVEGVKGYSVRQLGTFLVTKLHHFLLEEGRKGPAFDLSQESDGTLRMLGILTAIYQDPPRSLLAIEEPELTIHPGALGVLCDVLQEASARSQVVITTHSPDLIDRFPADTLRVVEKQGGVTSVGPVSNEQREVIARKLFSPGELLRMEGLQLDGDVSVGR